jgi:hypothetical protein
MRKHACIRTWLVDDGRVTFPSESVPGRYREPQTANAIAAVATSFARFLGRPLVEAQSDVIAAMWQAPQVILAHGTEPDPIFFFGNRAALDAFEIDLDAFLSMPSRLSAEAPLRDERQALLDRVSKHGFIDDYAGVRISATGRRFHIEQAVVWNVTDEIGERIGQAATFVP